MINNLKIFKHIVYPILLIYIWFAFITFELNPLKWKAMHDSFGRSVILIIMTFLLMLSFAIMSKNSHKDTK